MFTFDESYDPDLSSEELWAEIPEPIRKQVERHVSARLPAEVLAKFHAGGIPISSILPSSTLVAAWLSGTFAGSGSMIKSWQHIVRWAAIGTIAISGCSPRSLLHRPSLALSPAT
jgi:hypothetical protein